jgi:hypothetical protein
MTIPPLLTHPQGSGITAVVFYFGSLHFVRLPCAYAEKSDEKVFLMKY